MNTQEHQAFLYRAVAINARLKQLTEDGLLLPPPVALASNPLEPSPLDDFSLEARLQARRMGDVYELLYCLENSVRELIERTLREAYGPERWWADGVDESIRKNAEKRKQDEARARWHGPRGDSLINYIDFPQYADVIVSRWAKFEDLIGDQEWLVNYFDEMNRTRRALAHTGSMTDTDVERMRFRVREWIRVVG
jgi:hypothetical protein